MTRDDYPLVAACIVAWLICLAVSPKLWIGISAASCIAIGLLSLAASTRRERARTGSDPRRHG